MVHHGYKVFLDNRSVFGYNPLIRSAAYTKPQTVYAGVTTVQPADIGWPTGNGKKVSCIQACCLAVP